jgi:hypothetical protein
VYGQVAFASAQAAYSFQHCFHNGLGGYITPKQEPSQVRATNHLDGWIVAGQHMDRGVFDSVVLANRFDDR